MKPYHYLANLLCQATEQVLHAEHPLLDQKVQLSTRVGSGVKTYHRFYRQNQTSVITFGLKAVKEKFNAAQAYQFGTAKEILEFNFFNGIINTKNLLVAVVLHEYAHYIQCIEGKRFHRSVHNHHFYSILNKLHQQGFDKKVKDFLEKDQHFKNIGDDELKNPVADIKEDVQVGDYITFEYKGKNVTHKVTRVNAKTVSANLFKVPYHLILNISKSLSNNNKKENEQENSIQVSVGDFVEFFSKRLNKNIVAKITDKIANGFKCNDGEYIYKIPKTLIKRKLEPSEIKEKSPVIKDRRYFSYLKQGDKVLIKSTSGNVQGTVVKLNPKRAKCKINNELYSVPYQLILD